MVLNELSASNTTILVDDQDQSVDWIELYNADTVPVALAGWTLSDDADEPAKWTFPPLSLAPGEHRVVYASGGERRSVLTWDTRVDQGDSWRYLPVDTAPDPGWFLPGFDDGSWESGPSGFGVEDADDATTVTADTVYLRTEVAVTAADLAELSALVLHLDYDDAFVAYLNGIEVARDNLPVPGLPPAWDTPADGSNEAVIYQGAQPPVFDLAFATGLLVEGPNTLAIEVHQLAGSLDLSAIPLLTFGFTTEREARTSAVLELTAPHLHASFALSADGERVRLYDAAGCEVDDVEPGQMFTDQSYGRQPDGAATFGYFLEPTPAAANVTEMRPGFATTPWIDPPAGYVPGGAEVTISADSGSAVHVAWEGWEPTEADPLYTGPLNTGTHGEAVIVRARAFQPGLWPSRIATSTYVLREPGPMAIVSLVTDPPNLWDEETGIYVFGSSYNDDEPYRGANFWEDWERPIHLELWEPDGTLGTTVDAGVKIHGGWSRAHEQKSLLVRMRSGYGDEEVAWPVFPDPALASFDRLLLRASGTDWHGCGVTGCSEGAQLRDPLMHALTGEEDIDRMAYRPAEVYLNGAYWGIYDLRERPDLAWVTAHHGFEDIDLLEFLGDPIEGDGLHYQSTMAFLRSADLTDPASYATVRTLIDVDELTTYLVFQTWFDNDDWPENNIRYWRPRTPDGRWRWFLYDTDFGLGRWGRSPSRDTLAHAFEPGLASTELFRLLLGSPEFTDTFLIRYADLMNTVLVPDRTRAALHAHASGIATGIPRHVDRYGSWTDGATTHTLEPGLWDLEIAWIDEWLGERSDHVRQNLVDHFALAGTWELQLDVDPPGSGSFALPTVDVEAPFSGICFRGVPLTVTAVPAPGYTFVRWSDPTLPADPTVTLDPNDARSLVAHFQ